VWQKDGDQRDGIKGMVSEGGCQKDNARRMISEE
jgi:hypothetical protein